MLERRMLILVAALVVLLASAALWNTFVRPPARATAGATPGTAPAESVVRMSSPTIDPSRDTARRPQPAPAPSPTVVAPDGGVSIPVRVYFPPTTVANFQPSFLDAVRSAFQRWQDAGVPVRFNLDADSGSAEG